MSSNVVPEYVAAEVRVTVWMVFALRVLLKMTLPEPVMPPLTKNSLNVWSPLPLMAGALIFTVPAVVIGAAKVTLRTVGFRVVPVAIAIPLALFRGLTMPKDKVPPLTVTAPLRVLAPESVSVPVPVLVTLRVAVLPLLRTTPLKVLV